MQFRATFEYTKQTERCEKGEQFEAIISAPHLVEASRQIAAYARKKNLKAIDLEEIQDEPPIEKLLINLQTDLLEARALITEKDDRISHLRGRLEAANTELIHQLKRNTELHETMMKISG